MKASIDNFSAQASEYAKYRPTYPEALYEFLLAHVPGRKAAWDCGTGNGQVAARLAKDFEQVYATDLSEKQLSQAPIIPNVHYQVARAEASGLPAQSVQLITIGQALHWFDFEHFYTEVRRVAMPNALIAAWTYGLLHISPEIDAHILRFYQDTLGPYWDKERKLIDEAYATIPFPFDEIENPELELRFEWNLSELAGYLNTWSSVQKYKNATGKNPVEPLIDHLKDFWQNAAERKQISFPLHMRVGRVEV